MVKQVKTRRMPAPSNVEFNSRDLLLAGLGAASLTRKQGIRMYDALLQEGRSMQGRANQAMADLSGRITNGIDSTRERIQHRVAPIAGRAEATLATVRSELGNRLQPLLARFDAKPASKARAGANAGRRLAVRKPAKAAAKRPQRKAGRKAA